MATSLFIEPNGSTDTYFTFDTIDGTKPAPTNTPISPGGSSFGSTLSTSPDESDFLRPPYAFPGRSPSAEELSTSPNSLKFFKTFPPKIARPPNAWILYRSQKLAEFKDLNPDMYARGMSRNKADRGMRPTQASFSKQIAEMWANEPEEVKEYYHNQASLKSMVHAAENPGYRFNPNKTRRQKEKSERGISKSPRGIRTKPLDIITSASPLTFPSVVSSTMSTTPTYTPSAQPAPWQQQDFQWALAPPAFNFGQSPTVTAEQAALRVVDDRRPSLKAKWAALFPEDAPDSALSGSSFSSGSAPASSTASAFEPVSALWGNGLLPSLSISQPPHNQDELFSTGAPFAEAAAHAILPTGISDPVASISTPPRMEYSFAPPTVAMPSLPSASSQVETSDYSFWSPTTFNSAGSTDYSPLPSPYNFVQQIQSPSTPEWWSFRHLKVKPDEVDGIPLEDLIRSLNAQSAPIA